MLFWALIFFVVSLLAGGLGLTGVAGLSMDIAQILFWGFLILAAIFLGIGLWGARKVSKLIKS